MDRKIRVLMQGGESKGWDVYSGENTVSLISNYQTYEKVFQMKSETDPQAFLSVCFGKIDQQITEQHRVCIDDIILEEVEAPAIDIPDVVVGENMLKNGDFSEQEANWEKAITAPGEGTITIADQKAV